LGIALLGESGGILTQPLLLFYHVFSNLHDNRMNIGDFYGPAFCKSATIHTQSQRKRGTAITYVVASSFASSVLVLPVGPQPTTFANYVLGSFA